MIGVDKVFVSDTTVRETWEGEFVSANRNMDTSCWFSGMPLQLFNIHKWYFHYSLVAGFCIELINLMPRLITKWHAIDVGMALLVEPQTAPTCARNVNTFLNKACF